VSPSPLTGKYVAGYPITISASATQTTTFVGIAYVKLIADSSVIESVQTSAGADGKIAVSVQTSGAAAPGHYAGNVTVNVCKDPNCAAQLDGAPFKVPYVIDVVAAEGGATVSNAPALAPLTGAGDWSGFQANAAHTGMVPVTLNPSAFSVRWTYEAPAVNGRQMTISDIATGNGQLYFSTGPYWDASAQGHQLLALKEQDGSRAWVHDFGALRYATTNPPGFAAGKVVISAGSQESTAMFAFDAANGNQLFSTPMASQWEHYLAPVVYGGSIYSEGGSYGGMYAFDAGTGARKWFTSLSQVDGWTPAVDASYAYVYLGNQLQVLDRQTGASVSKMPGTESGWPYGLTPMLGAQGSVVVAGSATLAAFDTAKGLRWEVPGTYHPGPAYADKLIYVFRNQSLALEARNEADGALVWSWTPPQGAETSSNNILVTNNLVFLSTDKATYAIDRTTHAPVWSYPFAGKLAMSANGVLYINGRSSIVAVNLK
jgi:outer membrane protein assembly factor BamB